MFALKTKHVYNTTNNVRNQTLKPLLIFIFPSTVEVGFKKNRKGKKSNRLNFGEFKTLVINQRKQKIKQYIFFTLVLEKKKNSI